MADNVKVKVSDANGEPVVGAAVIYNGKRAANASQANNAANNANSTAKPVGSSTGIDGICDIDVPSDATLSISSIGYVSQEISVGGRAYIEVVLKEDVTTLGDVVVVGYATMKKRDLVGAVDQIGSDVLEDRPTNNLARSLQGEIAGLNISFTDGKPSHSANYNVRGTTSVGAGGSSLVLIDGVEGDINSVNPQDVESVSVLKDASSTAVYGARGAFGVILITTKSPKKGVPTVNYSGSYSFNRRTVIYDNITDSIQWLDWWKAVYNGYYNGSRPLLNHLDSKAPYSEAIYNEIKRRNADPSLPKVEENYDVPGFGYAYYDNTDWIKKFYKDWNGSTEHNLSVSGGGENADYYISGRFYGSDGIYKVGNENYKQYDLRAKGNLYVRPWLKIGNNTSLAVNTSLQPRTPSGQSLQRYLQHCAQPMAPVYNPDGSYTPAAAMTGYASFKDGKNRLESNTTYIREKIDADVDIIKDVLKFQADYSYNFTNEISKTVFNVPSIYSKYPGVFLSEGSQETSGMTEIHYDTRYQSTNEYLTFSPKLGDKHSFTALLGWNAEWEKYNTRTMTRHGFTTYDKTSFNLMDGEASIESGGYKWSYAGAFFRLNYGYLGRYLAEFSGRYDGSSKFPSGNKWGFFPSGSLGWRFSDEPWLGFMKPVLNNGKLRLSVGSMGNGNVAPYSYSSEMGISKATELALGGSLPSYTAVGQVIPSSLTWERSTTYDVGLDLDLLDSRLSFTGDLYRRITSDMYTAGASLPAVYGAVAPKGNYATMQTDGWELSIQWRDQFDLGGKPFRYSVKGTLWDNDSKITKFLGNDNKQLASSNANFIRKNYSYYKGMHIGDIWGYTVEGLFKDQADIDSHAAQHFQQSSDYVTRPGQVKVKDLNGDNVINYGSLTADDHGDMSIIGDSSPHYMYGINLSASWRGFGLTVFLQGVGKQDWYPGSDAGYFWGKYARPYFYFIPSIMKLHGNSVAQMSEDGSECLNYKTAYWPRPSTYQSNGSSNLNLPLQVPNTRYMQNIAYLRVKNVQVDYSFDEKVCKFLHLQALKVYFNGDNLFCFTPLHKHGPNLDPEGLGVDKDFAYTNGLQEGNTYPLFKSFTFGVNITF